MSSFFDRRRALMMQQPRLPSEYLAADYIQSDGYQWIDTGYFPNQDTQLALTAKITGMSATYNLGYSFFAGGRRGSSTRAFGIGASPSGNSPSGWRCSYGTNPNIYVGIVDANKHEFLIDKNTFFLDGVEIASFPYAQFASPKTLALFTANAADGWQSYTMACAIYAVKIMESGIAIRHFAPCVRIADNKPGMYDFVTKTFFTNIGSGEFAPGNPI